MKNKIDRIVAGCIFLKKRIYKYKNENLENTTLAAALKI